MTLEHAFGVSREDRGILRRMIVFSLLFHLFTLSLFFLSLKTSSPKMTFGPDYAVNLVSAADVRMNSASRSSEPSKEPAALPAPPEKVFHKKADSRPSIPVRKVEKMKTPDGSVGKAIEKIRKKVEAMAQKQSSSVAYSSAGKISDASAGAPSGKVSDAELGVRMKAYYGAIWGCVRRYWFLPPDLLPKENIEAVIHVLILRSGAVEEINFEKRSGNNYFDESAIRAVRKASPFPPLPEGVGEEGMEMGIRFHPSELR